MYAYYEKRAEGGGQRYRFAEEAHLFGCNQGCISWLLGETLTEGASEPFQWRLNLDEAFCLPAVDMAGSALIINLKPNAKSPNLSLYEVVEVFGFSDSGWTPVMFYLRGLFVDDDPARFDAKDFVRSPVEVHDPIFSMTYMAGTVRDGHIAGTWGPPGPSPTNSVMLWPVPFRYFAQQAHAILKRFDEGLL